MTHSCLQRTTRPLTTAVSKQWEETPDTIDRGPVSPHGGTGYLKVFNMIKQTQRPWLCNVMPTLPPNDFEISKTNALSDQTDFRFNMPQIFTEFLLCERRHTVLRDPRRPQLHTSLIKRFPSTGNSNTPYWFVNGRQNHQTLKCHVGEPLLRVCL